MYPYVSLTIKDHVPQIVYHPKEGISKKLTNEDENIYGVVIGIAKKLNLIDRELLEDDPDIFAELLDLARESDELYISDLPEIETESFEFDLEKTLNELLTEILDEKQEEYAEIDVSEEVREILNKNQKADIFASLLEIMYTTLIAKTVLAASELGIGTIKFEDNHKNARLLEKMSKELQKLNVELIVE